LARRPVVLQAVEELARRHLVAAELEYVSARVAAVPLVAAVRRTEALDWILALPLALPLALVLTERWVVCRGNQPEAFVQESLVVVAPDRRPLLPSLDLLAELRSGQAEAWGRPVLQSTR